MSLGKPGKLKMNVNINLNAMKPGAENPLIAKRRRESEIKLKKKKNQFQNDNESKDEYKQHPEDTNALSAKLNQVTITSKRRKSRRKSKKALLLSDNTINDGKSNFSSPLNPLPVINDNDNNDNDNNNNDSNGYIVSASNVYDEKKQETEKLASLIPEKPTPHGIIGIIGMNDNDNNKMSSTPQPPSTPTPPTPPPPPPPGSAIKTEEDRRKSEFVDIKKTPPPPAPPMFSSINKAPRDTAASTTFTVSGQKITIIGHARTGKTSLKNALFGEEFKEMTFPTVRAPPKPTIIIKPLQFIDDEDDDDDAAPDIAETDINVQYEVWDTPGQKVLEYIPPLYITGSFCVFVVYDITDTFSYKRAKYWITYLEEVAKGYDNVVLIGNKYDLEIKERCIKSEDVQIYADQHEIFFIEISVKTKHNFDVLLSWLNQKTSEKVQKEIQIEEKNNKKNDKIDNNNNNKENKEKKKELNEEEKKKDGNHNDNDNDDNKKRKMDKKMDKKRLLKEHQRNNKTIQLDKIDVHSRNKKNKTCCLW